MDRINSQLYFFTNHLTVSSTVTGCDLEMIKIGDSVREIKKSPEKYKNVIEGIVIKETKEHILGKNYR